MKKFFVCPWVLSFVYVLISLGNLFGAAKPEEMVTVRGLPQNGTVQMGWCKDEPEFFQVIVDTESAIDGITIKPKTFKIVKDQWYIANGSRFVPYPIKATKDGEIDLNYSDSINCMVTIRAYPGNDPSRYVWTNGSFEEADEKGFPRDCDRYIDPRDATGYTLTVTNETAHSGKYSLKLRANDTGLNGCGVRLNKPVPVEPGQEYLVQGWYKTTGAPYGAGITFKVSLWSDNKKQSFFFDTHEVPLVDLGNKWNRAFVTFKVPDDLVNPRVKVLVLQTKRPVTVYWDDFAIMPKPHEAWQYERPQTKEQMTPDFTTEDVLKYWNSRDAWKLEMPTDGKPGIKVDGKPLPLYVFMSSFGMAGWPMSAAHKDFFQQGFELQFVSVETERTTAKFGGPIWKGDNDYDFTALEKRILALLEFNPKAKVGLYVSVWPYRKFGDVHPEAAWINAMGQKVVGEKNKWRPASERKGDEPLAHSLSAEAFRKSASDYLFAFGQFLKKSPAGKAVVGIHLCGGTDGQWFKPGWTNDFGEYDRCEGARVVFGQWLKEEYKNDLAAFRKAWGDESLTFETVVIPPEKDRNSEHYLLDPNIPIERRVIDANRFIYAGPAETINRLAESFKKGIGRPAWVTTYYHNQHMGYWFLLQKPWLDGTVSVPGYGGCRRAGNVGDIATIPDSLRLHNRFFLGELDYRTELAGTWQYDAHSFDKTLVIADREFESGAAIWRDLGGELSRGGGAWHYALMGNAWNAPRHMKYMGI
ncbi:MAG: hypothetical protein Q4G59_08490, partial [Planctomycetia bacterium]|nr:hypothetical protein [Planctomycetia bacterium]